MHPHALIGHSVGEYAAACAARIFNIEEGMKLVTHRGRLMQALPTIGKMAVVLAQKDVVEALIARHLGTVSIAAFNGPTNTVISGLASDVDHACMMAEQDGFATKPLVVSHAFHSPLMLPMIEEFKAIAASIAYHEPQYALISNLTGQPIKAMSQKEWSEYWCKHVLAPVQFHRGMQAIQQQGCTIFLEVGPAPVLTAMGKTCIDVDGSQQAWLTSLKPKSEDEQTILTSLAQLYTAGIDINWKHVNPYRPSKHVSLPAYPFQRQRYWFEKSTGESGAHLTGLNAHPDADHHPLLGQRLLLLGSKEIRYQHIFYQNQPAYLEDQTIYQQHIAPESAILSMVWEAARRLPLKQENICLQNIALSPSMPIPKSGQFIQLVIHPQQAGCYLFSVISVEANQLNELNHCDELGLVHATGEIIDQNEKTNELIDVKRTQTVDLQTFQQDAHQPITIPGFYQEMHRRGIEQSAESAYKVIRNIWVQADTTVLSQLALTEKIINEASVYHIHPTLLNGTIQSLFVFLSEKHTNDVLLPIGFKTAWFNQPAGHQLWALARNFSLKENAARVDIQFLNDEGRIIGEMNELRLSLVNSIHLSKERLSIVRDWLYHVAWQPQESSHAVVDTTISQSDDYWLLISSKDTKELQRQFELANQRCITHTIEPTASMQPSSYNQYSTLLNSLDQHSLCKGILYVGNLQVDLDNLDGENLQVIQQDICSSVLALVQTMSRHATFMHTPLMLITRGSQALTEQDPPDLAYASLWGLSGVISNEYPELRCTRLDLDPQQPSNYADLIHELNTFSTKHSRFESQLAYRKGQRYVARLEHSKPSPPLDQPTPLINDASSYLVTGGLGALGLVIAEWFIQQGAQHIVLTSRHEPNERALQKIQQLCSNGAKIFCTQADVANMHDVRKLVHLVEDSMPPLKGIIHAAGVLKDGLLEQQNGDYFDEVMAPKIAGAWNIHQATQHLTLDFFIQFSSVATVFGATGQGNYAAANAFLDSLSHYRRAQGLACQSINWGPWAENGMARNVQARFRQLGMMALTNREGLEALENIMISNAPQSSVVPINWEIFYEAVNEDTVPRMLRDIWLNSQMTKQTNKTQQEVDFLQQLQSTPIEHRHSLAVRQIAIQFAKVVGIPSKDIDPQKEFSQFGMDSLMLLELRNRLNKSMNCSIPISTFLDYPTLEQLANFIMELVGASDDSAHLNGLNKCSEYEINSAAQLKWSEGEL